MNCSSVRTLNSNGEQYNKSQQYELLLCQNSNSNGEQYNKSQQYELLLCKNSKQ